MALLPYPEPDDMEPQAREAMDRFAEAYGRPTLAYRMLGWFPPAIHALEAADRMLSEGALPRWFKELLFVAGSDARGCHY